MENEKITENGIMTEEKELTAETGEQAETLKTEENTETGVSVQEMQPVSQQETQPKKGLAGLKEAFSTVNKEEADKKRSYTIRLIAGIYLIYTGYNLLKGFFNTFTGVWNKDALVQSIFGGVFMILGIVLLAILFLPSLIAKLKLYKKWSEEED